jgi:hypothetical protein
MMQSHYRRIHKVFPKPPVLRHGLKLEQDRTTESQAGDTFDGWHVRFPPPVNAMGEPSVGAGLAP